MLHGGQVGQHQGERLAYAQLAPAQLGDGLGVGGVTGQVEATQAFDGYDFALAQQAASFLDGGFVGEAIGNIAGRGAATLRPYIVDIGNRGAGGGFQPHLGATDGAGHRLGMEAAVERVLVFGGTVRAERETRHGGVGPVVGDVTDDGETRAAVGAVDERVAIAPIGRVEQLAQAVGADAHIRRDGHKGGRVIFGMDDLEAAKAARRLPGHAQLIDARQGWGFGAQGVDKLIQHLPLTVDFDVDPGGGIAHPTGQPQARGQAIDERPETDALDDAADMDAGGDHLPPLGPPFP